MDILTVMSIEIRHAAVGSRYFWSGVVGCKAVFPRVAFGFEWVIGVISSDINVALIAVITLPLALDPEYRTTPSIRGTTAPSRPYSINRHPNTPAYASLTTTILHSAITIRLSQSTSDSTQMTPITAPDVQ